MSDIETVAYPTTMRDATIEIKRLRAENEHFKLVDYYNGRNAIIEECARAVEAYDVWHKDYTADPLAEIAAAIRALKDKP